jgi:ribonuclease BN (tRNA processing enzyme)
MRVRALGVAGGEVPGRGLTSFLIDDHLALDAGHLTGALSLEEQAGVERILLTHAHLDHMKDVAFLADNMLERRADPVIVAGTAPILDALKTHLLNDVLWPDFTVLPSPEAPVLRLEPIPEGRPVWFGSYTVHAVSVSHAVPTVGYLIARAGRTLVYAGDSGPTDELWKAVVADAGVRAVIVEASFPNRMESLARVSGHLTPSMLREELGKLGREGVPVYVAHVKAGYLSEVEREVNALGVDGVRFLSPGDTIEI